MKSTEDAAEAAQNGQGDGKEADEESPLLPGAKITWKSWITLLISVYEPHTDDYRTNNPGSLMLVGIHLGMTFMQLLSIFGAYAYLVSNAYVVFPACSKHRILDKLLGLHTGVGWLCEGSSILLWTFPLFCCMLVPFFEYWEFCDSRLYYECLRHKILLEFPDKSFFTSPIIVLIVSYLLLGLTNVLFNGAEDLESMKNVWRVIAPFLLPVASFMMAVFAAWDIKFNLLTLANFAAFDIKWAKGHLMDCEQATVEDLAAVYEALAEREALPVGGTAAEMFGKIRTELVEWRASQHEMAEQKKSLRNVMRHTQAKIKAILFGTSGYWVVDLFWSMDDVRSKQFRLAFRVFRACAFTISFSLLVLFIATVMQFLHMQGHTPWEITMVKSMIIEHKDCE